MTADIPAIVEAIPALWFPMVLVGVIVGAPLGFTIFILMKVILNQQAAIIKTVDQGQIIHEMSAAIKGVAHTCRAVHSIVSQRR